VRTAPAAIGVRRKGYRRRKFRTSIDRRWAVSHEVEQAARRFIRLATGRRSGVPQIEH